MHDGERAEHPKDTDHVLLCASGTNGVVSKTCRKLLTDTSLRETNLLVVSYLQPADRWLEEWLRRGDEMPANLGYVHVGGFMRSAAPQQSSVPPGNQIDCRAVANPTDLTGLNITLGKYFEAWAGDGNRTVICFRSITVLLQYVDLKTTYRFLHVLTSNLNSINAGGHFHFDPEAYDQQTLSILASLFDTTVECGSDGLG